MTPSCFALTCCSKFSLRWGRVLVALLGLAASELRAADVVVTADSPEYPDLSAVGPGDTIYLQGHTRSRLYLREFAGSAEKPVRIVNREGRFVVDGGENHGFVIANARHFIVDGTGDPAHRYGIEVRSTRVGSGLVIYGQSSHFEIRNVEIQRTDYAGILIKSDDLGPDAWTYEQIKIHHCYIHHTANEGIYIGHSHFESGKHHLLADCEISHNIVSETGADGIQLGSCTTGASIHDNTITSWGLRTSGNAYHSTGIRWNPGTAGDCYNNILIATPVAGQTEWANHDGIFANPHNDSRFFNNLVVGCENDAIVMSADHGMLTGTEILLANNTVVSPGANGIHFYPTGAVGSRAVNNLIVVAGGEGIRVGSDSELSLAHNLIRDSVAAAGFVDPASADYRLQATSPAVDAGTDTAPWGITRDLRGAARPQSAAFDVGAYEGLVPASKPGTD